MVRIESESPEERFDALLHRLCEEHGLRLDVTGWTRKTYDVCDGGDRHAPRRLLLRVETFALTNGEILLYDPAASAFAQALGTALEEEFGVAEAIIRRAERSH